MAISVDNGLHVKVDEAKNLKSDFVDKISADKDFKYLGGDTDKFNAAFKTYGKAIEADASLIDKPINEVLTGLGVEKINIEAMTTPKTIGNDLKMTFTDTTETK